MPFLTGGQQVAAYTEVFCNRPSDVTVRSRLRADLPSGDVTVAQNGCATGKPSCVRHLPLGYTYFYLACPKSPTQQHNHSYYTDIVLFPGTRSGATGPMRSR